MFSNFLRNLNKTCITDGVIVQPFYSIWFGAVPVNLFQSGSMWLMRSWRDNFHAAHGPWRWPAAAAPHPRPAAPPCPVVGPAGLSKLNSGQHGRSEQEAAIRSSDCPACSPSASWSSEFLVCYRWSGTGKPAPTAWMPAPDQAEGRCCPGPTLTLPARSEHRKRRTGPQLLCQPNDTRRRIQINTSNIRFASDCFPQVTVGLAATCLVDNTFF